MTEPDISFFHNKKPITITMINGDTVTGVIKAVGLHSVLIEDAVLRAETLVFKSGIATARAN